MAWTQLHGYANDELDRLVVTLQRELPRAIDPVASHMHLIIAAATSILFRRLEQAGDHDGAREVLSRCVSGLRAPAPRENTGSLTYMPTPNGLTAATLTGNGYVLSNGVYSQAFGGLTVNITLLTEAEGNGFAASVNITGNDTSGTDARNAAVSLANIGLTAMANQLAGGNLQLVNLGPSGNGLTPAYYQTV